MGLCWPSNYDPLRYLFTMSDRLILNSSAATQNHMSPIVYVLTSPSITRHLSVLRVRIRYRGDLRIDLRWGKMTREKEGEDMRMRVRMPPGSSGGIFGHLCRPPRAALLQPGSPSQLMMREEPAIHINH